MKGSDLSEPLEDTCLEEARQSLLHIRKISIDVHFGKETLNLIFQLMPNLKSLRLIHGPLEFSEVASCLLKSKQWLERLELHFDFIDEGLISLVHKYSKSLQELRLKGRTSLTQKSYAAISTCSKLRHLELNQFRGLEESHLSQRSGLGIFENS